jgi:hypothetical protein
MFCLIIYLFYSGESEGKVVWMTSESYAVYWTRTRMLSLREVEKHAKYKDGLEGTGSKSTKRTENYNKDLV